MNCWHQAGRQTRRGVVTCRHCGVAIEYCPCTGETFRHVDHNCRYCHGSMWVAIVRGPRAAFQAYCESKEPREGVCGV